MAWSTSNVFTQAVLNPLCKSVNAGATPTGFVSLVNASEVFVALFGSGVTPDKNAAVASTGYNTGTWLTSNESSGTGYTAGGAAVASPAFTAGTSTVAFTATNQSWTTVTVTASGDLVYDNLISAGTVAKQGYCFNYFGGSQSVTAGTFTIAWNAAGVFNFAT